MLVGLGIRIHALFKLWAATPFQCFADFQRFAFSVEHAQEHRWITNILLGLLIFINQ